MKGVSVCFVLLVVVAVVLSKPDARKRHHKRTGVSSADTKCKQTQEGTEYRGTVSTTVSGRTCQRWDSQYPHEHTRNDQSEYPDAVYNEANYCRNPDHDAEGPWCYTTDPDKRWEHCAIPLCGRSTVDLSYFSGTEECTQTIQGTDYRGSKSTTLSGLTCQRWDSQYPHRHTRDDVFEFPDAIYNEENYCRNPDRSDGIGPWCYTTDENVRWEPCGIPMCPDCRQSQLGNEYRGQRSVTVSGRTCQRWDSQYPHGHTRNDQSQFPDAAYNEANYCRNPDHEPEGPWCYTTDPDKRWEYCEIPFCSGCRTTLSGSDYLGNRTVTISGRTCQRWDSQYPHEYGEFDVVNYPNAINLEANYCRNPDTSGFLGPWCYTTDPNVRWEICGIPFCPNSQN